MAYNPTSHSLSHRLTKKRKSRLTDLQQRKAFKLRANGLSYREIANLLGTSKDSIWRLFSNEDEKDIKIIDGKKYRLFNTEAFRLSEGKLRQAYINHYIITLEGFNKVRLGPRKWYYEIKPHRCPYQCIDSGPQDIYESEASKQYLCKDAQSTIKFR